MKSKFNPLVHAWLWFLGLLCDRCHGVGRVWALLGLTSFITLCPKCHGRGSQMIHRQGHNRANTVHGEASLDLSGLEKAMSPAPWTTAERRDLEEFIKKNRGKITNYSLAGSFVRGMRYSREGLGREDNPHINSLKMAQKLSSMWRAGWDWARRP